ncbi:hypothetical protein L596_021578 [Steinernema carpocapsae]|uniref:Uncharacterized protein n=1 Tax=Steinernema carpocapsae TaxID=34508 RepID=A0A4U5MJZ8_STECR|nr:hypothetical protein L596_021578 [Steinernema carpocapsae]
MGSCLLVVIFYAVTYLMLYKVAPNYTSGAMTKIQLKKQKNVKRHKLVVRECCGLLLLFNSIGSDLMRHVGASKSVMNEADTYAVIPGLLSYSLNYYVLFWKEA